MKEKPILFSGPMVRAMLSGRKTQTRRIVKPQPQLIDGKTWVWPCDGEQCKWSWGVNVSPGVEPAEQHSPYKVGDCLWVRETFAESFEPENHAHAKAGYTYRADWDLHDDMDSRDFGWKPSIFMPRAASRITLEVTAVKCERVQDISRLEICNEGWPYDDQQAEGVAMAEAGMDDANIDDASIEWFADLWEQINGHESWDSNPFVFAYGLRRIQPCS